jgi:hypothetical protein
MILIQTAADKLGITVATLSIYLGRPEMAVHKKYEYGYKGRRAIYITDFVGLERKLKRLKPNGFKRKKVIW